MKETIKIFLVVVIIFSSSKGWAQTNHWPDSGNVGIGTTNPAEKLEVRGNILLPYPAKVIQKGSNAYAEYLLASHGQGSGWMINATYSGSGNPQSNATFSVNPGVFDTGAGYLDFDGNSKRWSFFLSKPSTGVNTPVSFDEVAYFDYNGIALSPSGNASDFHLKPNGNIGIGTNDPDSKLSVNGTAKAKEVIVTEDVGADFVFEERYPLSSLSDVEQYIQKHKRLPEVPPASEMIREGVKVGELQMKLLQKVEELTLHLIEHEKKIRALMQENRSLKNQIQERK